MMKKGYQRKHLRAPYKESMLYADGPYVLRAQTLNLSEGGILLNQLPSFPETSRIPVMFSVPEIPALRNYNLLKLQVSPKDLFKRTVVRVKAELVRRDELSQNLDNIFRSRFGLKFVEVEPAALRLIGEYVENYTANLTYLQTLIDSYETDEETRTRTRTLAAVLGYPPALGPGELLSQVLKDYKSLQWL